ncbi:M1 family metallopeptidase [Subsaximicrobium wynnwilliamsii]|uniref:M1 family metallopeptidase n=1 Tax=Subsaximicrobium wynnwilliamsii TaxID=291179 RepID=A0A5C6ZFM1_9FLAO|nr:M1 family metallopeptidase [Subsaximicrobium wynnwilliamsii]TXD83080.1 M1 family metallopeptidase [Subsaximicrobium wynnwilliamsii]TXD88824.1 M1 family metallopeptidase [Subsaximicrobium wynnwilliamsii]TXE02897.1 M1 family metallopeptidase [Subsaximicrobium wynnwilliamsii]
MKHFIIGILLLAFDLSIAAQGLMADKQAQFTHQDSLRGSITPERAWWDLTYYHLEVQINPDDKSIKGKNTVQYTVLNPKKTLQIDLQSPLTISKIVQDGKELQFKSDGNAHFVTLEHPQPKGSTQNLEVYYEGHPKVAVRAPWDGGFSWKKDDNGNDFIATSCQGLGASVWWPCKDHMYDEVDSMLISVTVPKDLMDVSNGRLRSKEQHKDGTSTYNWFVGNPINNYGVNVNVGDYVHFAEDYAGENGNLTMDYYVLPANLEKAKVQFKDATRMMEAFEYWFGPYPFYEDGFKLVEVPYLGMEHQSSVTYGNQYMNGYLGRDLSGTGWGLKFDFIIIHESGHEWFANNITNKDIADMWIHEGFTAYSENLFLDYFYGKEASSAYVIGTRRIIENDKPIIGPYGVNQEGSGDMYYKGANILHTLRQLINDDQKWRQILRGLNEVFYHQTVTTKQIEDYISQESGMDLSAFFNQYLRDIRIPTLEYSVENNQLKYRWANVVADFKMPVQVSIADEAIWLYPTSAWKNMKLESNIKTIDLDADFYVFSKRL